MTEVFHVDSYSELLGLHVFPYDVAIIRGNGTFVVMPYFIPQDFGVIQDKENNMIIDKQRKYKPSFPKVKGRGGKFKKY